ncbi:alpha-amylase family glycosyl hydrolase [Ideonella livida]|uniref:alpha-amylase family glycosyl hydrolase n=1 Tax=Ideonella livida TaxID=2707176 RepID=UPI002873C520|nr:alpha-amylase family glycosyl hydrolase [Ideonella livida]
MNPQEKTRPTTRNPDWWRGAVIYQIYPRSFADTNGDGVGDLPGITAHLDHVARLGVDAIWISPFFKSPMKDFGYDVADYREIDPLFGTLADFDVLLARAHALGLKVIIDQVLSHTSDQHAWFQESRGSRDNPRADWYVWADPRPDGSPPNNWLSVFGGSAWQWDSRRRQYYLHSFLASQPDLNFHNPRVQAALIAEVRFWCERGVDGFRFDACNHQFHDAQLRDNPAASSGEQGSVSTVRPDNPYAMQRHLHDKSQPENLIFLEKLRRMLDLYGAASVGEVGDENAPPLMAAYTEHGRRLHMAYSFSLLTRDGSARHIRHQVEALERALSQTQGWGCWALSNHDVPRVATRWSPQGAPVEPLTRTLLALLLSLRGSVSLYQGEELGLPEADIPYERLQDPYGLAFWPEFKGRDGCRTPMPWVPDADHAGFCAPGATPWLPLGDGHAERAVAQQDGEAWSTLAFTRRVLAWRRQEARLRVGDLQFHDAPEPVLLLERRMPQDSRSLLLAFNLGPEPVNLRLPASLPDLVPVADAPLPSPVELSEGEEPRARPGERWWHLPPFGMALAETEDTLMLDFD